MWRFCDLHNHTLPNEQCQDAWDADVFVRSRIAIGLDLVAVTDHDHLDHVNEVTAAAAGTPLIIVPGVELSTDHGHLLVLSPGQHGQATLRNFMTRVGAAPGIQVSLEEVLNATRGAQPAGETYAEELVLIGAHVDQPGAILAPGQALSVSKQLKLSGCLHALEVSSEQTLAEWGTSGVKQSLKMTLVRGSDCHDPADNRLRGTWIYLPEVTPAAFQHAFAMRESSVSLLPTSPATPDYIIESIRFDGGHHDGLRLEFSERTNAIIGPPNAGKSLIIDALKFVFGVQSDLPEVENISSARMAKCMSDECTVEIRVRTPSGTVPLIRTVGAARPPTSPFHPIVFSQTELTRRAIAPSPAISLLDLHFRAADSRKAELQEAAEALAKLFESVRQDALKAMSLRSSVRNAVDGLAATRAELSELAGSEEVAKTASGATSVTAWRDKVRSEIALWRQNAALTPLVLPEAPTLGSEGAALERFVPKVAVDAAISEVHDAVTAAVARTANTILKALSIHEEQFSTVQLKIEEELSQAGFARGSEIEVRLSQLRNRLGAREGEARELQELDARIDDRLVKLRLCYQIVAEARRALTDGRREACRQTNQSMHTFYARVDPEGVTLAFDHLINDLATGTYMRTDSRQELRRSLDRFGLLETAIRMTQGVIVGDKPEGDQERLVTEVLRRERYADLANLSCLWPGDALILAKRGSPPTPFEQLTEGLRALAIKEISFASSELPVITDQPEDAVPTRSIFESLVPTLREQRAQRQFIVVSHDANIVVASDIERIIVLQANEDNSPHVGDLFDTRIRIAALEHLEGGREAFRLRADRYAAFGEHDRPV